MLRLKQKAQITLGSRELRLKEGAYMKRGSVHEERELRLKQEARIKTWRLGEEGTYIKKGNRMLRLKQGAESLD